MAVRMSAACDWRNDRDLVGFANRLVGLSIALIDGDQGLVGHTLTGGERLDSAKNIGNASPGWNVDAHLGRAECVGIGREQEYSNCHQLRIPRCARDDSIK